MLRTIRNNYGRPEKVEKPKPKPVKKPRKPKEQPKKDEE